MSTELRDTSLMTDVEWNRRFEALADSERAKMQRQAGALGVNLRLIDPARYSAAYHEEQQTQAAAQAEERRLKKLQQPVNIDPVKSDTELTEEARRRGLNPARFINSYKLGRSAQVEAEAQRKQQLAELTRQRETSARAARIAELEAELGLSTR